MLTQTSPYLDVRSFAPLDHPRDGTADWAPYIQAALDYITQQGINTESGTLYMPPGKYRISHALQIRLKYNGTYTFCSVRILGDSPGFGANTFHGSAIIPDFTDEPALVIQSGRAVSIENLVFVGKNDWTTIPGRNPGDMATHHEDDDAVYLASQDIRDNRFSPYAAIHIDPYNAAVAAADRYPGLESEYINQGNGGGSSSIHIRSCDFRNFVVGIGISLNGTTQNAENIAIVDCSFGGMKSAIAVGQTQSRNITVRNVSMHGARTAFDCTGYGQGSGDGPSIFGGNIGNVKYVFATFSFGGEVSVSGLYCENIYSIGHLGGSGSRDGHTFDGCSFKFGSTPPGTGAIPYRLANLAHAVFNGCTFGLQGTEPIWIVNAGGKLSFNQCTFGTNTLDGIPKLWVSGTREWVWFQGTSVSTVPRGATFTQCLSTDYIANLYDYPMLPGTLFQSLYDQPSLRWVSSRYPWIDLGNCELTIPNPPDGTAKITIPAAAQAQFQGRVAPGGFLHAAGRAFKLFEAPHDAAVVNIALGKVSAVSPAEIHLEYVPNVVKESEMLRLLVMYLPRVHPPTKGTMDLDVSRTRIEGVTDIKRCWRQYERIRDQQKLIAEGTYIVNDPVTDGFIELSRPAQGSGTVTLDLYDADVYELNMAQVF